MTISEFFKLCGNVQIDTRIAVKDVTGAHIFEGELHMFQSHFTRLFNIHNIISFRYIKDKDIWEFEIW